MNSTTKIKWISSFIISGTLLILAFLGGTWGMTSAADASVNAAPYIDSIHPSAVRVGSSYKIVIISGENFGTNEDYIRVFLNADGIDYKLEKPENVIPDGISQLIPDTFFDVPEIYLLYVIRSDRPSIPTLPIVPPYDFVSNSVPFVVYEPQFMYLPDVYK